MGIRFNPGLKSMGINPDQIEKLIEAQAIPLKSAQKRRESVVKEKDEIDKLSQMITELDGILNGLKTKYDFTKLKLDSSHPDIIDGSVQSTALIGTYELEVRSLAKAEKELAYGFPDKDDYPVGFGFLYIEREDAEPLEIDVEPYTTLQELATQINEEDAGVKAMVINTGYKPDAYRLIVISEQSGKEAKLTVDEDTTFLEFKEQVTGRNLDVLFEDVPITDTDNTMDELIDGVTLQARRSEPGTRVQISILHDIDATVEMIAGFVEKYNQIAEFISGQFKKDAETGSFGVLSGDSSIKFVMRQLQNALFAAAGNTQKYTTLAQVGITSEPRTGLLQMDESKVRAALSTDYEAVSKLFIRSSNSVGIADQLANQIRRFRDPGSGVMKSRKRALQKILESHDQDIERRQARLEQKEASIRQQFTALEGTLASLKGQSDFLKAKLGGGQNKGS
ncbi:MAG: flagellar filament capping protein FliD [Zetaproteobacteria bacterium]|nr:flagellar filament capping protein FliD [Zetaproteobacteria bacterium]